MESLKQRILTEGRVLSETILKVDSFLNHQIDPLLVHEIGREFARRFEGERVTKVLTLEASGISMALMTALALRVPLVFAKRRKPSTMGGRVLSSRIRSFTRGETYDATVSSNYIVANDRVLIIDDFLATGEAALGMVEILEQAGATTVGIGIVIEKAFDRGGPLLRDRGLRVESLVRIQSMKEGVVRFAE